MAEALSQLALDRRATLGLLGLGGAALASCGSGAKAAAACLASPRETRGPFAADGGSDAGGRLNILEAEGVIRRDIRSSFAGLEGTAEGVPLDLEITIFGVAGGCNTMAGWAVYLWQNDAAGAYSLYNLPRANYLRGLQQSDDAGRVRFQTILPGCYGGRAPHVHFEVYSSAQAAISGEPAVLASQFAFTEEDCRAVYAADARYGGSLGNLERWNNSRDFVFRDGDADVRKLQTIALTGGAAEGFRGEARIGINY
ncbi:MAG: intradiol ring-cleavage dioxygenase [Croceibacterium sp.]